MTAQSRRIRITTEIYNVNAAGVDYAELPPEWDDWTPAERHRHLEELAAEALAAVAGAGVAVVDDEDRELDTDTGQVV